MGKPFDIRKEILLEATPDGVWQAIATGAGLAAWFMPMDIDPKSPMVTAHEPGRRLAVRMPAGDDGAFHTFDYVIEAAGPGTSLLRFVHSGIAGDDWGDEFETTTRLGWDMYLHTLAQYLTHFPGRPALYLEAEAPPASATDEGWPRLLAALGLTEPVEEGTGVRFDVPGLGPVEGIVDYVTPSFVGLRAPFALVRFHNRTGMGMPVAVSQHTYIANFDVESAYRAWQAWLASVFA